jgi:hypothetical protein
MLRGGRVRGAHVGLSTWDAVQGGAVNIPTRDVRPIKSDATAAGRSWKSARPPEPDSEGGGTEGRHGRRADLKERTSLRPCGRRVSSHLGALIGCARKCQTACVSFLHEKHSTGAAVPSVGRRASRGGPQAQVEPAERSPSGAAKVPQRSAARHCPHPSRSLESAHASLLPRPAPRLRMRVRKVRLPPGALLGTGEPRALHRRGAGRCGAWARDEGAGGPDGARSQQGDAPPRSRVCRSLPRTPSDVAARGRQRGSIRARELEHPRRS